MPGAEFLIEFEKIKKDIENAVNDAHKANPKSRNKKLTVEHKHELSHKHEVKHKVELTVITALTAALAFILALSWHDALTRVTDYMLQTFFPDKGVGYKFLQPLILTIVVILGIYILTKLQQRIKFRQQ